MDVPKDDVNSQFTFLLKEDTGWFDAEFKFDV